MNTQALYKTDFTPWVDAQTSLLSQSCFAKIGISHLIEGRYTGFKK